LAAKILSAISKMPDKLDLTVIDLIKVTMNLTSEVQYSVTSKIEGFKEIVNHYVLIGTLEYHLRTTYTEIQNILPIIKAN